MLVEENTANDVFIAEFNSFTFSYDKEKKTFKTLKDFTNFIADEVIFWKDITKSPMSNILSIYNQIDNVLRNLQQRQDIDEQAIKVELSNIHNITRNSIYFIKSSSSHAQFLTKLYKINPSMANAAWLFLNGSNDSGISTSKISLLGVLNAFYFTKSLEVENLEANLASERLDIIAAKHFEAIQDINESYSNLESSFKGELTKEQQELSTCKRQLADSIEDHNKTFKKEFNTWNNKLNDLEKLYSEHLRLKAPAEYWNSLREEYDKKGRIWVGASLGVSLAFVVLLSYIFYDFPYWLKGSLTSDHLKGFIVFTLLVSVFTYLLHLFSKLAISSYHLSRDATERYQLTHVYLALLNEKTIEPSEREIILQALFSRADTGLIKNDGAPTMPGASSIIDTALKSVLKK